MALERRYPPGLRSVIDVTKPPYSVDKTGTHDCTAQLIRIFDDVLQSEQEGMAAIRAKLMADPRPNVEAGFETRKTNGVLHVVFPEELAPPRIIWFPNGIYLLSDTVSYTRGGLHNTLGNELNRCLRLVGESSDGVILRLRDCCAGFGAGAAKPVLSFQRGRRSNVAMSNYLENLTIEVGAGNPGAIGVVFFANNAGAVRNVKVRSVDPERRGDTGFAILHELASGILVQDLEVTGFDFGVRVEPMRMYAVFDRIALREQRDAGFAVGNTVVSIHGLRSVNAVPALVTHGPLCQVTVRDAICEGGAKDQVALALALGVVHASEISSSGYRNAVTYHNQVEVAGPSVAEYHSHAGHVLFGVARRTLGLEVEPTPAVSWPESPNDWISVNECGAKGDGVTDDTAAIQRTLDAGVASVYFQPGRYLVNGCVTVPQHVKRINFMFVDLVSGERLRAMAGRGFLTVTGVSEDPLVVEDLFAWERYCGFQTLIDHASTRTLVLSDLHTQAGALYRNSVRGGKVFIENCACTIGSRGVAEDKGVYGHVPCLEFHGQKVWARQLNPERSHIEVKNVGSSLWVLGFKTEGYGSAFVTSDGGSTEVLGGVLNIGKGKTVPAIVNENSDVSVVAVTNGYSLEQRFPVLVREVRNGEMREILASDLPRRFAAQVFLPLYAGRSRMQKRSTVTELARTRALE